MHYLAVPPSAFARITEGLGEHGLAKGSRVVYEKPFGTSPEGFRELDEMVHKVLDEDQVFRIDHFLGKEATQNLHVLRFANGLFDAVWCREHVRAVQIDVPEKLGITDRAEFYDATGAVLDMLVTHLFQVAAEVAMEPPASLTADDLQAAREEVIGCFRPIDPDEVVLGQFEGFRDVDGVARRLDDRHLRRRPAVDRQRPLARRAVPAAHRQAAGVQRAAGQPDPARAERARSTTCRKQRQRPGLRPQRQRRDRPAVRGQAARARARTSTSPTSGSRSTRCPTATRCRPTSGSSTTCSSATARCSPARTGWPRCGRPPARCSTHPPKPQPYPQGSWGPAGRAGARRARRLAARAVTGPALRDWRRAAMDHRRRVARPRPGRRRSTACPPGSR